MSNTPAPKFDPAVASKMFTKHGHSGWLGLKFRDNGQDWVELELPWREDLVGDPEGGILASGPIISLMDMASGLAVWTTMGEFRAVATLDLRVDYMRPAREGAAVVGHAHCYRLTRSAAFVRGYAHDGDADDPVANVAAVFMAIPWRPQ